MCQRCYARTNDPRDAIIQAFSIVESMTVKEIEKLRAHQPAAIDMTPVQDHGAAKMLAMSMQQDPAIAAVKVGTHVVWLN